MQLEHPIIQINLIFMIYAMNMGYMLSMKRTWRLMAPGLQGGMSQNIQ